MPKDTDDNAPFGREDEALIAKNLRTWRLEAGLSQEQAAAMTGVTMITLQRLERAETRIEVVQLMRLAELYGQDWRRATSEESVTPDYETAPQAVVLFHPRTWLDAVAQAKIRRLVAQEVERARKQRAQ